MSNGTATGESPRLFRSLFERPKSQSHFIVKGTSVAPRRVIPAVVAAGCCGAQFVFVKALRERAKQS